MATKSRQTTAQRPRPSVKQPSLPPRKSLKQSLKDVFLRTIRKSPPPVETVGSGILRRAETTGLNFQSTTTLSSFSDTLGSQIGLEDYTISRSIPNRFQSSTHQAPARSSARQSLLPATSLSQFNLHQAYLNPSTIPRRAVLDAMSPSAMSVTSRQASIATLSTLSVTPSVSTLRIQESRQSLVPSSLSRVPAANHNPRPKKRQPNHVSWLQSPTASSVSVMANGSAPSTPYRTPDQSGVKLVEHFKSFCILDTAAPGCPVVATSRELCYIFEIGEQFVLNNSECEGASMDIVTGLDAAGDSVTHLVLFTPLIIPSSGRSRFMLACLVDVTKFINDAASLPELDQEADSSTIESELPTPLQERRIREWQSASNKLSADDLLGGCMLPADRKPTGRLSPNTGVWEDIWLNLANEEKSKRSVSQSTARSNPKINHTPKSIQSYGSTSSSAVDDVLDDFMGDLQELYSEFFLLGKSPLDEACFEICNVSPVVFQSKDYINGHLSRTDQRQMAELSESLARGSPFHLLVKWGVQGVDKRLYCSPMYTATSITWICFLVDHRMPLYW